MGFYRNPERWRFGRLERNLGGGSHRQLLAHLSRSRTRYWRDQRGDSTFHPAHERPGYSTTTATRFLSILLASSLGGRVVVGYFADRFNKKNTMALFYLLIGGAIPLLCIARQPSAALAFTVVFGFAMGADYMLIPLVTADCFGVASLGKLLALIIMGYSIGQWIAPWIAGRVFDAFHGYNMAWAILSVAGLLGAVAIYAISVPSRAGTVSPSN